MHVNAIQHDAKKAKIPTPTCLYESAQPNMQDAMKNQYYANAALHETRPRRKARKNASTYTQYTCNEPVTSNATRKVKTSTNTPQIWLCRINELHLKPILVDDDI